MGNDQNISIVVVALNEERNIKRLLTSVQGLTDDVIVVDTGSSDKTIEICKDMGVRVYEKEWEGYSATKNYANTQAKNPWVLSLDADEALSSKLFDSIKQIIPSKKGESTVYSFNRLSNYCGTWIRHGGWYPDKKIRIWHRNFGYWEGLVHEKLIFKSSPTEVKLKGDLLHYTYYTILEHKERTHRYASLHAEAMHKAGKRCNVFKLYLSPALRFLRDYIFRGGFLDGKAGLTIALISSGGVYKKYQLLREKRKSIAHPQ